MNNRNRKSRTPSARSESAGFATSRASSQRGRSSDSLEGVYQNMRFLNTTASLIGNSVQVHLLDGKIIEGIFTTISPNCEVVLELAHEVDPKHPERINVQTIEDNLVFSLKLIVTMTSKDIELDYSSKDAFPTDSSITRYNGLSREKELEPWDGGNSDEADLSLDSDTNGWNANDMFKRNEQMYNVQSNFEEDLSQYTTKLEKKDTREYRELEERASRLASSIESNVTSRMQVELENDSDEEEKFASVTRSDSRDFRDSRDSKGFERGPATPTTGSGRYIPPPKRKDQGPAGRVVRSTPPPRGHGPHPNTAPRHQHQTGGPGAYHGSHYESEGSGRPTGPSHAYGSQSGPQHQSFQGPQARQHYMGRHQGYPMPRGGPNQANDSRFNGEDRKGAKESSPNRAAPATAAAAAPSPAQPPRGDGPPKEQRKSFAGKPREEQQETKTLNQEIRTQESTMELKKTSPATTPAAVASTPTTPTAAVPLTAGAPPAVANQPAPPEPVAPPQQAEVAPTAEIKADEELDKVTETLKKSKLNPNAKEFVFNPNAKVFTPRSPSTPTPPRSHTPQTGQGAQLLIPAPLAPVTSTFPGAGAPGHHPVMLSALVYPNYVAGNPGGPLQVPNHGTLPAQHFNNHAPGNPRFRKVPTMTHRPELTSPMQVAAATGQPLLAPAPLGTPQFIYPSQSGMVQSGHQQYAPMYMRVMAPQGMNVMAPTSMSYQEASASGPGSIFMSPNMAHSQPSNAQSGMASLQHHPSSSSSPAQHHPLPQGTPTPAGTPQQVLYQPGNPHPGPLTHNQGPPMPIVYMPQAHNQPPGSGMGNPQGVQIYPLGSTSAGIPLSQYHYIQQAHGGQPSPMQPMVPHNNP